MTPERRDPHAEASARRLRVALAERAPTTAVVQPGRRTADERGLCFARPSEIPSLGSGWNGAIHAIVGGEARW